MAGRVISLSNREQDKRDTHVSSMPFLDSAQVKSDLLEIDSLLEDDDVRVLDVLAGGGQRREGRPCILSANGGSRERGS